MSINVDHFRLRVAQDALIDGLEATWRRRAAAWEWARPRPDDYAGRATPADLRARDRRCADIAQACRNRAQVCR